MSDPWNVTYEASKGCEQTVSFFCGDSRKDAEAFAAVVGGHVWQHDRQILDEAEAFVGKIPWLQEQEETEGAEVQEKAEAKDGTREHV